ncbi:MAG: response regulator [Patescibacteria group bacterium]|nr:response regulator [Patescibacteria group bacterium]
MTEEKSIKILIIEDEQSLVDLLMTKLKKEGYTLECAYDGEDGFKKIKAWKPELILLDIVMPKMDGYEVLEKMNEAGIKVPVIIISNSGQPVEIEKTKKLGAVDHLIKTEFSPLDVIEKVQACLSGEGYDELLNSRKTLKVKENEDAKKLGINVLLVEDDAFLREISSKKLTKEGYSVYEAIDGEEAIEGVKTVKPDIVLLDIILPAVDGFQVLSYIRKNEDKKIAKVPVIMLSNLGQEDDIKKAKEMGVNDYLVKAHFTTKEIIGKINELLKK